MTKADRDASPLQTRYASEEMAALFSAQRKFETWRLLWLWLAEEEQRLGLPIPDEAIGQMRAHLSDIDFDAVAREEERIRHDVMAHVKVFGKAAPAARPIVHWGATSAFVTDNADLIVVREALGLLERRLAALLRRMRTLALEHRSVPALAWTHYQPAQPTTVGKRATLWLQDLLLDVEEIEFRLETLRFRGVRGTTGTQASFLDLFEGDGAKVEALNRRVAEKMGFAAVYGVTGQTYTRKVDYGCLATLAGVAQSASKFGYDLRLLSHLREVEEPFEEHQIGSSAMPYKRNPMRAERIDALARHAIALVIDPAFTAATQWFERTLDDSANKRIAVPESYLTIDSILLIQHNVAAGLVVYPEMIRRRLMEELPFMATENLMMRSVKRGGDRQDLHERVRQHSVAAGARIKGEGLPSDLLDRIAADDVFGVTREELEDALRPELYVGRAPQQVDEFLEEWVRPVLDRYSSEVGSSAPELHV
jgi:adenylosuccinate lyase